MTEAPRRLDQDDDELIASMFEAARQQRPSARSRDKTFLALGAGAGLLSGHATANAASIVAAPLLKLAAKWTLLGGVVVGAGVTAVELQSFASRSEATQGAVSRAASAQPIAPRRTVPPSGGRVETGLVETGLADTGLADTGLADTGQPMAAVAPELPEVRRAKAPEVRQPVTGVASRARASVSARPSPGPEATVEELEREVALLDRASEALARRDFAAAASLAEQYLAQFDSGRLEPEARYLKMQAQRGLGDVAGARAEAQRLIEVNPDGPHTRTAEAVRDGGGDSGAE